MLIEKRPEIPKPFLIAFREEDFPHDRYGRRIHFIGDLSRNNGCPDYIEPNDDGTVTWYYSNV